MSIRRYARPGVVIAGALVAAALGVTALTQASPPARAARYAGFGGERFAQATPAPSVGATKSGRREGRPDPAQMRQRHEEFMNRLAANLGVTRDQLVDAFKKTRIDGVDRLRREGKITQEQADKMLERINAGLGGGFGPPGPGHKMGGPGGRGHRMPLRGVATEALGVSQDELAAALKGGQSLAEFAQSRGISREDLEQRLIAAHKKRLDEAAANNHLTADQAKQIGDRFAANIDRLVDGKRGQRQPRP
jgi:hypothetical protein